MTGITKITVAVGILAIFTGSGEAGYVVKLVTASCSANTAGN